MVEQKKWSSDDNKASKSIQYNNRKITSKNAPNPREEGPTPPGGGKGENHLVKSISIV
jgi:hypothetical protein